ncbi:hypothetical protein EYR36_006270 [Pleurotus pulmonarius]|nr:hypothetical protein EYR36_006270 [Pleurotus pulmonarius]KAF4600975.1 hypothetical protein EYR38_005622 [Pleurotus pulmonarius]
MSGSKVILVIGATGAQGMAVIDALLAPASDGSPSPYSVRALTRDPSSPRAQKLIAKGVECIQGTTDDLQKVATAFEGAYGAWVNTDGFTIGEQKEIYAGLRIFEVAKRTSSIRHYVWSSLDYGSKKSGYSPEHRCEHYDGKGRVAEFLKQQDSVPSEMTWTIVTSGPYFELLYTFCGPFHRRPDGTFVFASIIQDGHVPFIALADLGWWARYTFDHRAETSGKDLEVASDMVGWDYLVKTFTEVTGHPAVHDRQSQDEWWLNWNRVDKPIANERGPAHDGSTSGKENFSAFWSLFRDDIIKRDLDWIRSTHPTGKTLESWMKGQNYQGTRWLVKTRGPVLKNEEDGKSFFSPNLEVMAQL